MDHGGAVFSETFDIATDEGLKTFIRIIRRIACDLDLTALGFDPSVTMEGNFALALFMVFRETRKYVWGKLVSALLKRRSSKREPNVGKLLLEDISPSLRLIAIADTNTEVCNLEFEKPTSLLN